MALSQPKERHPLQRIDDGNHSNSLRHRSAVNLADVLLGITEKTTVELIHEG